MGGKELEDLEVVVEYKGRQRGNSQLGGGVWNCI